MRGMCWCPVLSTNQTPPPSDCFTEADQLRAAPCRHLQEIFGLIHPSVVNRDCSVIGAHTSSRPLDVKDGGSGGGGGGGGALQRLVALSLAMLSLIVVWIIIRNWVIRHDDDPKQLQGVRRRRGILSRYRCRWPVVVALDAFQWHGAHIFQEDVDYDADDSDSSRSTTASPSSPSHPSSPSDPSDPSDPSNLFIPSNSAGTIPIADLGDGDPLLGEKDTVEDLIRKDESCGRVGSLAPTVVLVDVCSLEESEGSASGIRPPSPVFILLDDAHGKESNCQDQTGKGDNSGRIRPIFPVLPVPDGIAIEGESAGIQPDSLVFILPDENLKEEEDNSGGIWPAVGANSIEGESSGIHPESVVIVKDRFGEKEETEKDLIGKGDNSGGIRPVSPVLLVADGNGIDEESSGVDSDSLFSVLSDESSDKTEENYQDFTEKEDNPGGIRPISPLLLVVDGNAIESESSAIQPASTVTVKDNLVAKEDESGRVRPVGADNSIIPGEAFRIQKVLEGSPVESIRTRRQRPLSLVAAITDENVEEKKIDVNSALSSPSAESTCPKSLEKEKASDVFATSSMMFSHLWDSAVAVEEIPELHSAVIHSVVVCHFHLALDPDACDGSFYSIQSASESNSSCGQWFSASSAEENATDDDDYSSDEDDEKDESLSDGSLAVQRRS